MKKNKKNLIYPPENEKKQNETIRKLKSRNKRLERDNRSLRGDIQTYKAAFYQISQFIKDNLEGFSVEECIKAAKSGKTLIEMQEDKEETIIEVKETIYLCPKCKSKLKVTELGFGTMKLCENIKCDYKSKENK